MKISDNTSISMPMRNLLSILAAVAVGVWGYFGLVERLTLLEMQNASLTKDLEHAEDRLTADIEKNNEFRIQESMAGCLRGKRTAERQYSQGTKYQCLKVKAELESNIDGSQSIKKIILE